ncbi:Crp/Fnr family transcriptional regulator [Polymorphobacter sp. PAMC 29334]|uniref:Crp/Fnr family transcriptional regulator n=1 Tax=Polymorphobacter sp. PAMC 29334 TaxID=2862331 RepID=UPI001C666697|nr:Crp/Fnr family transcriptional regulator [Polymorphobacter sp. PAMC 29334]QYE36225.1 Crp/Fnr family transcriptional regulator [Polymorphobacter sp. PAMC 29334]
MSIPPDQSRVRNLLLRTMSPGDFALLAPHLTIVDLPAKKPLSEPNVDIATNWFFETAIASVVAMSPDGHQSESGFIGRCGFVDIATLLGSTAATIQCYIQVAGTGFSIPTLVLQQAIAASPTLNQLLLRYVQAFIVQVAHTALSNAAHSVEERLARWLLMCFDRIDGDEVALTHEFLSLMLNVRRSGVTEALASLSGAGLIATRRGFVTLRDLGGLRDLASDSYGAPEEAYEKLIGATLSRPAKVAGRPAADL